MGIGHNDHKINHTHYCSECDEKLHPETEQWSIADVTGKKVKCEVCVLCEEIDFDKLVDRIFKGVPA